MIHDAISKGNKSIDLTKLSGVTYIYGTYNDARIKINSCIMSGNVLVLHSNYHANNIKARGYVCMGAGYKLRMMESIDNSDFYNLASEIDQLIQDKASVETIVYLVLKKSGVSTTQLNKWIKVNRLVPKQASEEKVVATALSVAVGLQPVKVAIIESIGVITKKIGLPVQRIELLSEILSSSMLSGRTVREEVTRKRNIARVQGRKLYGKVIGTTLLTKGLESDTVILIKPSEFFKDADGLKHLYVALTRAVKEIILIDY